MWDWRPLDSAAQQAKIICRQVEYEFQVGTHTNPVYMWPHTTTQCCGLSPVGSSAAHSLLPGGCSVTSGKARLHHAWWWLRKANSITLNILPFLLLPPALYAEHDAIWYGIQPWAAGVSCALPTPCALPGSWLAGCSEEHRGPWLCVSTAQPEQKHPCVFNALLNTNPKHSPAPATLQKPTLSQSKPAHPENTALAQAAQAVVVLSHSDQHQGLCVGITYRYTMWAGTVLIYPIYPVPAGTWGTHESPEGFSPTHLQGQTHKHKAMDPSCNQSWTLSLPSSWPWMPSSIFAHIHTYADRSHSEA